MLVNTKMSMAVLALLAVSGTAMAQVAVDGRMTATELPLYGAAKFLQTNPTSFDDNLPVASGDPQNVVRGIEFKIAKSAIGYTGGPLKLKAFVGSSSNGFLSNQFTSTLPPNQSNFGEPRNLDFQGGALAALPSFLNVTPAVAGGPITVDGQLDAGGVYGPLVFVQGNFTQFGNSIAGTVFGGGGSEIDNVRVAADETHIYLFIGGNIEPNFNILNVFFDTEEGGQNRLRGDNPTTDFGSLNRLGDSGSGNGLRFGAGFEADYWLNIKGGTTGPGPTREVFLRYAKLTSADGSVPGVGYPVGKTSYGAVNPVLAPVTGGTDITPPTPVDIIASVDNSNVIGVNGTPGGLIPNRDLSIGDEINALYSYIADGKLNVMITGNLSTGFNKLVLFFDHGGDGQNVLRGNNVNVDFNRLNRMGENLTNTEEPIGPGVKFDAGFKAGRWYGLTTGGSPIQQYGNSSILRSTGPAVDFVNNKLDYGAFFGGDKNAVSPDRINDPINFSGPRLDIQDGFTPDLYTEFAPFHLGEGGVGGTTSYTPGTPDLVKMSIDNNNVAGVSKTAVGNPGAVRTGMEFQFDLQELGYTAGPEVCLKIAGWIAADNYDVVSNQILGDGTLLLSGNLTSNDPMGAAPVDVRNVDFSQLPGNQFIVLDGVCPPVQNPCFVDFNADGFLNQEDLGGFLTAFLDESVPPGPSGTNLAPCPGQPAPYDTLGFAADYNRDCNFDQEDLGGYITEFFSESENPVNCIPG